MLHTEKTTKNKRFSVSKQDNDKVKNNDELAFRNLMKVLLIYSKLDKIALKEKYNPTSPQKRAQVFLKGFVKTFDEISSFLRNNTQKSMTDEVNQEIANINADMLYMIWNVSMEECHYFFM